MKHTAGQIRKFAEYCVDLIMSNLAVTVGIVVALLILAASC